MRVVPRLVHIAIGGCPDFFLVGSSDRDDDNPMPRRGCPSPLRCRRTRCWPGLTLTGNRGHGNWPARISPGLPGRGQKCRPRAQPPGSIRSYPSPPDRFIAHVTQTHRKCHQRQGPFGVPFVRRQQARLESMASLKNSRRRISHWGERHRDAGAAHHPEPRSPTVFGELWIPSFQPEGQGGSLAMPTAFRFGQARLARVSGDASPKAAGVPAG